MTMEAVLERISSQKKQIVVDARGQVREALAALSRALEAAEPILKRGTVQSTSSISLSPINLSWLLSLCRQVPSELGPSFLARSIVEASKLVSEAEQQAALFDALGASDEAMHALFEIAPRLDEIRKSIDLADIPADHSVQDSTDTDTLVNLEEERRQWLLREAIDAAQIAAIAKAEVESMNLVNNGISGATTHTIQRKSDLEAQKYADKAAKRAAQALARAKEAGAIVDESDLLAIDRVSLGDGGLVNRSKEEIWALQQSLLPEGSRQYYDERGLPRDAIRESTDTMEKVIIPAKSRSETSLHPRLNLKDIMSEELAVAFEGTATLNPMQSTVFEVAFHSRINMLVCAPTGAGKTNVAMLTVVSHFRDVGLIGRGASKIETGKKVVYMAPMKALAQEVVEKFSSKLKALNLIVRELTGDMQLTRAEAESANVIVTTPEKWDVVTRKSGTDEMSLGNQCGLLIIDEVHLLADERGAVIESVIARVHRLVESRQRLLRIVALSATLPNYEDVADFLQVPERGIFYFGPEHRPVPLQQTFIGVVVNKRDRMEKERKMNDVCFDVVLDSLKRGYQVMVFVHSRKGTSDTANILAAMASEENVLETFFMTKGKEGRHGDAYRRYADRAAKSRNREVSSHFENGFGIHHAGMLRGDRKLTEQMFNDGAIRVLCCTATLAWGINLPAHTVVIKGTEVYNPEKGGIVDLSILDVQQIFGRAGRPQFDNSGEATLITTNDAFPRYINKLVRAVPIESNFIKQLADHLNAEVVGGTVTNAKEAARWLTYTYLYVRMLRNPSAYGISWDEKADDPTLRRRCLDLVQRAAEFLDQNKMVRFDRKSGNLSVVQRGRVAAHFYIQVESVAEFHESLAKNVEVRDENLCKMVCSATEFKNMKLRPEELDELQGLLINSLPFSLHGAGGDEKGRALVTSATDKGFILLQAYIGRAKIRSFTLVSDTNYMAANAGRVARAFFEMSIAENNADAALGLLRIAKSIDRQMWWFKTPLRNFEGELPEMVYQALEALGRVTLEGTLALLDMQPAEVGLLCKRKNDGEKIKSLICMLPKLDIDCTVLPITSTVLRLKIDLTPAFKWNVRWHGWAQTFWIWVENEERTFVFHCEQIHLSKKSYPEIISLEISIPLFDDRSKYYFIQTISDSWVGVETQYPVAIDKVNMPKSASIQTRLLDLTPLPISALCDPTYESLYKGFQTFNPIQTQLFHVLYNTNLPVLLGAPTGSGKTLIAELAILRMKKIHKDGICVYIAPLKALARERLKEWKLKFASELLGWHVLELSGDTHHDEKTLDMADVLVCTPEKWDLISRAWRRDSENCSDRSAARSRNFVKRVRLLVLDEVHLLGEERGAVLEAIVSRTRFISRFVHQDLQENEVSSGMDFEPTRIIGLSTALENPVDLADWIGIETKHVGQGGIVGLYNFNPALRIVPTSVHIQGFSGKHYCPRMASMNKPCYAAIKEYSPSKPTLIFVASRRQTRLTAFEIISLAAADDEPKRFLGCSEDFIEAVAEKIRDEALRHVITCGIGIHHAGLSTSDREIVEQMFLERKIQVLVATATLAWGINCPAHLVIVKGTEYFDGKSSRYVDFPLTDVLQMIGRAGRPGFDTTADAVVMVEQSKKNFYTKFLYQPFPVESCLKQSICENLNAEIASGTVRSFVEAVGYLTWTFFARRVKGNPSYYGAQSNSDEDVETVLIDVVSETLQLLREEGCVLYKDGKDEVHATVLGKACSDYYLLHNTPRQMEFGLREARKLIHLCLKDSKVETRRVDKFTLVELHRPMKLDELVAAWLLYSICCTHEFDEFPVRHNEEYLNEELSEKLRWGPDTSGLLSAAPVQHNPEIFASAHTKAFILIQAYLERITLPISDYVNDSVGVTENIPRLLAAVQFIAESDAQTPWSFDLLTQFPRTMQLLRTRSSADEDPLFQLPGVTKGDFSKVEERKFISLLRLRSMNRQTARSTIQHLNNRNKKKMKGPSIDETMEFLYNLPLVKLSDASVKHQVDKLSGKSSGTLTVTLDIERQAPSHYTKALEDQSFSLTFLLGTFDLGILLSSGSIRLTRFGKYSVSKALRFDWALANAHGGEDGGKMILRLLFDEVRGLDCEVQVKM